MKSYVNVWDAIEHPGKATESLKARSDLMIQIEQAVRTWDVSQSAAAKRLGVSQPRLSDLLRGKIERFSLDALFDLAVQAGLKVSLKIRRAA